MSEEQQTAHPRITFQPGKNVGGYEIFSLIGRGGFGDVYKVRDKKTSQLFAMKTEYMTAEKPCLQKELAIIEKLTETCFPQSRTHGEEKGVNYYVMNLMGPSIADIRRASGKIDIKIALSIGIQMVLIIQKFHEYGYVHRDIKPSNFLLQHNSTFPLCLIDFGLAKVHIDPNTKIPFPEKTNAKFAGTKKYASIHVHENKSVGRRDDLYSWFYSMIEILVGELPWGTIKDPNEMYRMKHDTPIETLCNGLPNQFIDIFSKIHDLNYDDIPDYSGIVTLLREMLSELGHDDKRFDWNSYYMQNASLCEAISPTQTPNHHQGHFPRQSKEITEIPEEENCCFVI